MTTLASVTSSGMTLDDLTRVLLIGSNEWSDIMHADLVIKYGHGAQEERFSHNVYLHPALAGMEEYQTVHGSADDIAARDLVNPLATLRAAAVVAERHGGCAGAVGAMEAALLDARRTGLVTRDMGGECGTAALVEHVLERIAGVLSLGAPASPIIAFDVALDGAGRALFAGLNGIFSFADVGVLDVADPSVTGAVIGGFELPGQTRAVVIAGGLGYAVAQDLHVLGYVGWDRDGIPPEIGFSPSSLPAGGRV